MVTGAVRTWLRIEGAAALALAVGIYLHTGGNAWYLVPLVLAVDLSMVGYLASPRLGAITYNALHSWTPGLALLAVGLASATDAATLGGAVLAAHVGMDRMAGYGLKYPTTFAETHLGRIGRR